MSEPSAHKEGEYRPYAQRRWEKVRFRGGLVLFIISWLGALFQFVRLSAGYIPTPSLNYGLIYVLLALGLVFFLTFWVAGHRQRVLRRRALDSGDIDLLLSQAQSVGPRSNDPLSPSNFDELKQQMDAEIARVKSLPELGRIEAELLGVMRRRVEFLPVDDLIAEARYQLGELESDYSTGSREDEKFFEQWRQRVEVAIEKIPSRDPSDQSESQFTRRDIAAEELRAVHKTLLDNYYDYQAFWATGTVILHDLILGSAVAMVVFLLMGILPILPLGVPMGLTILHWGLLGIAGALASSMLVLSKEETVRVGQDEGENILWRAVLSVPLGFAAGLVTYCVFWAELVSQGSAVPKVGSLTPRDAALSVLWALAAGMIFQRVLEGMRQASG